MFELVFILLLVLVALIVLGLFFKGEVWRPSFTVAGKKVTISIAVPQVALSIAGIPVEVAKTAPPAAK